MDRNNQLGQNLKRLLVKREMKASQLAEKAEITCAQLSRILNGKSYPSIESLRRLARALDVTPGTLLDGKAPDPNVIPDEPFIDRSIRIALRSFKKLSKRDRDQLTSIIERYARTSENQI